MQQAVVGVERHAYTGTQIFQRLRAREGYTGGLTILADDVRTIRRVRAPAFLILAFAPGECGQVWSTQEHLALPLRSPEFFSVFMSGNKFVSLLRKLSGCDSISSGVKEGVRESQWIG
jgi:hypothetical protein